MFKKTVIGIFAALLLAGAALSEEGQESGVTARLKEAGSIKRTSFKQEPAVKQEILLKTVDCYRSVLNDFPGEKAACAEASFRMGEILRTLKKTDEAEQAFKKTLSFDQEGEFAARALKEIGHLFRRDKKYDQAIAYYQRVQDECPTQKEVCADALTWTGKIYLKQGQHDKARNILIGFADRFPEFPEEVIRNIDLAAGSWIDDGQPEKAAELLSKWRQHFESALGGDERVDGKIVKALERMKSPERLKE